MKTRIYDNKLNSSLNQAEEVTNQKLDLNDRDPQKQNQSVKVGILQQQYDSNHIFIRENRNVSDWIHGNFCRTRSYLPQHCLRVDIQF